MGSDQSCCNCTQPPSHQPMDKRIANSRKKGDIHRQRKYMMHAITQKQTKMEYINDGMSSDEDDDYNDTHSIESKQEIQIPI